MIIRHITANKFMTHDTLSVDLPDKGVVLVTGPNGAGKSAIIETCSHALFGKSVRGEWGWRDVEDTAPRGWASVTHVITDYVDVTRVKGRGSPVLSFQRWTGGKWERDTADNTSKAQASLERVIGGFDLWLRSHVFSSGDAAHFTLATDAKRKRFLEAMLGIEYFDGALDLARTNLALVKGVIADHDQRLISLEARRTVAEAGMSTAGDMMAQASPTIVIPPHPGELVLPLEPEYPEIGPVPAPPELPDPLPSFDAGPDTVEDMRKTLARVELALAEVAVDIDDARLSEQTYRRDFTEARARLNAAQAELAKWPGGACPTCEQPVPPALLGPLTERTQATEAESLAAARVATDGVASAELEVAALTKRKADLDEQAQSLRDHISRHDAQRSERLKARADLERRHADEVARCNRQRANASKQHADAHAQRIEGMKQRWQAECAAAKREHAIRLEHHTSMSAEAQRVAAEHAASVAHYTKELVRWTADRDDVLAGIAAVQAERLELVASQAELEALEDVFGLKGVRANVLGNALSGLESISNTWLERIGKPGQKIRLREYTEKDKGGNTPALSLELSHAERPAWHRYRACSGGERRRVDVALILALAEIGRAAHGRSRGTLFFDEVFDALDTEGIGLVTAVLDELGQDRCIVVISHNEDLVKGLNPALHVKMKCNV